MLRSKVPWRKFVNSENQANCNQDAFELLDQLLKYDHHERVTAAEALQHAYFNPVREALAGAAAPAAAPAAVAELAPVAAVAAGTSSSQARAGTSGSSGSPGGMVLRQRSLQSVAA